METLNASSIPDPSDSPEALLLLIQEGLRDRNPDLTREGADGLLEWMETVRVAKVERKREVDEGEDEGDEEGSRSPSTKKKPRAPRIPRPRVSTSTDIPYSAPPADYLPDHPDDDTRAFLWRIGHVPVQPLTGKAEAMRLVSTAGLALGVVGAVVGATAVFGNLAYETRNMGVLGLSLFGWVAMPGFATWVLWDLKEMFDGRFASQKVSQEKMSKKEETMKKYGRKDEAL